MGSEMCIRDSPEIVEVCALTTGEQDAMLKDLLERYLADTGSEKASELLADWPSAKSRFKVLVPPSERAVMGLTEKQAIAA